MQIYPIILTVILIFEIINLIDSIKQTKKEKKEWEKFMERANKNMEGNIMKKRKYSKKEHYEE